MFEECCQYSVVHFITAHGKMSKKAKRRDCGEMKVASFIAVMKSAILSRILIIKAKSIQIFKYLKMNKDFGWRGENNEGKNKLRGSNSNFAERKAAELYHGKRTITRKR